MNSSIKKRLWIGVVVVVVALLAFASPSIIAGLNGTADASGGCSMGSSSSDASSSGGCDMMGGSKDIPAAGSGCPMMSSGKKSASATGGCAMMGDKTAGCDMTDCKDCSMLTGTVVSVNKRDGSITVKVKPTATDTESTSQALSQIKVKDTLSMAVMLGKDCKPAAKTVATSQAANYVCPMHPEVTSDKPGTCSKCGMNLQKVDKK